jgi:hypothetical protein
MTSLLKGIQNRRRGTLLKTMFNVLGPRSHSKHRHGLPICVVTTMHDSETEVYGANNTEQIKLSLSLGDW